MQLGSKSLLKGDVGVRALLSTTSLQVKGFKITLGVIAL